MIARICILAAGVLLAAAGVLLWKKLSPAWRSALLAGGILTASIGGVFLYGFWQQRQRDREYVYLSLRYLQNSDTDSAAYYLKKVGEDTFESLCAESLLETMRGNGVLAQMKMDGAEAKAKTSAQQAMVVKLDALGSDAQSWQSLVDPLLSSVPLSDKQSERMDARFVAESNYYLDSMQMVDGELWDEEERLRQNISRDLRNTSYSSALSTAATLVQTNASAKNRLLLAETIAEATYGGYEFTGQEFADPDAAEAPVDSERERLWEELQAIGQEVDNANTLLWGMSEEQEIAQMTAEKEELTARQSELQNAYDYLYARRAFNSIADIHTLDAEIVRARLYFAMNDYAQATDLLQEAGRSLSAQLTANVPLRNALQVVNTTYEQSQPLGAQSEEFRSAVNTVLTTGAMDYVGISVTPLTEGFTSYVISELRQYGRDLYATEVNLNNFPEVTITLSGRDTAIEKLVANEPAIVRDTRQEVSYTVEPVEGEAAMRNVICVVDESGSMDGEPLLNAQTALRGFINSLDVDLPMALVGFDDDARLLAEMGSDTATLLAAVDLLGEGGGTEITAGLRTAIEAAEGREGSTTVLLMTDGQSSLDMSVVEQAAQLGMVVHTIGFGSVDDNLLQTIADSTGGQYIRAEDSNELIGVYLSLVGMIGNQVRVHYTAPDLPEENQRYFFLRLDEDNISVRVDYTLEPAQTPTPLLTGASTTLISTSMIRYAVEEGEPIDLTLYGERLQDVTGVTIGGLPAAMVEEAGENYLRVEVEPQLAVGWQAVELTESDGAVTRFENVLVVGETVNCNEFYYGPLHIRSYNAVLLPEGTLVFCGGQLDDIGPEESYDARTLDMYFEGTLWLPVDAAAFTAALDARTGYEPMTLETTSALQGAGMVQLGSSDSGYDGEVTNVVASGSYLLQADGDQIKLIQQ